MAKSRTYENKSVSFPGWVIDVVDHLCSVHKMGRSDFINRGIPKQILSLKRKAVKVEMLRKFRGAVSTNTEKASVSFECPAWLKEVFESHCEEFGCDWSSLFIIGAVTHILSNAHPDQVLDNEFDKIEGHAPDEYDGIVR